jgi:diguanylate cyclase (GGDEF)-like protein
MLQAEDRSGLGPADARAIDALLHGGLRMLRFPANLESRFQQDTARERLQTLLAAGALVSILFNWMLLSDWMMIPDRFDLALRWRLMVYTPGILFGLVVIAKLSSPVLREASLVLAGVVAAAINVQLCVHSTDPMAGPYLISVSVVLVYCNTVARMRLRPALCLDVAVLAMFFHGWHRLPDAPFAIMAPAALTVLSLAVFTLYGAYMQERDVRQNWLLLMREKLLQHELLQANESLEEASRNDQLTELASRRHFDAQLEQRWAQAKAEGQDVSVILLAVDHFKACQASLGQVQADAALRDIADLMRSAFQGDDKLLARFAGEEFAVLMVGTPLQTAVGAAESIRKAIENLRLQHGYHERDLITASLGVSCMRPDSPHANPTQLISVADEALHLARQRGRNRVIAFGTQD